MQLFEVTHPFHPLCGKKYELIQIRYHWGERRVDYYNEAHEVKSFPVGWTDAEPAEPFVSTSAGRALLHIDSLLKLADIVNEYVGERDPE